MVIVMFNTVDGSEILHQLRLVVYPVIYKVLAPSQVVFSPDFWTINSQCQMKV